MSSRYLAVAAVSLMVVATIAVGAGGFVGTARAATLVVDDDGRQCPDARHSTITSAVASASSFDTIQVCSGTYNESVNVDVENLRLIANGSAVMDANATKGVAFHVEADDVWIEGFEMQNYTSHVIRVHNNGPFTGYHRTTITNNVIWISGPGAHRSTRGIHFKGRKSNDITVTNNLILDAPGGPSRRGMGVFVGSIGTCSTCNRNAVIENNTVTARNQGIFLGGGAPGSVVRDNTVTVHRDYQGAGRGIRVYWVRSVEVSGNDVTVLDSDIDGIVGSVEKAGDLTIENNTVDGGKHGVRVQVFRSQTAPNPNRPVVVQSNEIADTADDGIRVTDVDGTRVIDNTVTGAGDDGMVLANADELTATANRISEPANDGMVLHNGVNFTATGNDVTGATNGIRLKNSDGALISANHVDDAGTGLWFEPGNALVNATGNVVTHTATGIWIQESGSPGLTDSRLDDLSVSNASSEAVLWGGTTPNTTVTNLTLDSATVDFSASDVTLQAVDTPPPDPLGQGNVGVHVEATSLGESAFLDLTTSYSDEATEDVNESTISYWTFDGAAWSAVPDSRVNTTTNHVSANLTGFSTVAPLGTLTDSTVPTIANVTVDVVGTRTISMSFDSSESLAVIEAEITNETGSVVEDLTLSDFRRAGTDPISYATQTTLDSAGTYTVTLTNASDQAVNDGASGENAPVRLVVEDVSIEHVNGTAPDLANLTSNVYLTQGPGGLLQVQLRDASDPTADLVNRTDLEDLGVEPNTTLAVNLTLVGWTPRLVLGTGHDVNWATTDVGGGVTTLNLTASPAETQLIESQLVSPDQSWPTGANDRADVRTNATVDLAVTDMGFVADPAQRSAFDGAILATDAQTFGTPQYDPSTDTVSLFVGGPHLSVDGANNTGFFEAFLPDALLAEWGVTQPDELTVRAMGEDATPTRAETVPGGVRLFVPIHYSEGEVEVRPAVEEDDDGTTGGGSSSSGSASSSSGSTASDPTPTATPTPTPTPTSTPESTTGPPPEGTAEPTMEPTTEPTPSSEPTSTDAPGQPGFDVVVALVAVLGAGLLARRRVG